LLRERHQKGLQTINRRAFVWIYKGVFDVHAIGPGDLKRHTCKQPPQALAIVQPKKSGKHGIFQESSESVAMVVSRGDDVIESIRTMLRRFYQELVNRRESCVVLAFRIVSSQITISNGAELDDSWPFHRLPIACAQYATGRCEQHNTLLRH